MPVGTTTLENLLRVARCEAAAGTAFAAVSAGTPPRIVSVPASGSAEGLSDGDLAELVRQASADPEFTRARVFVRSVRAGRPLTLAVAPLQGPASRDMIGLVAERERTFDARQLEVLERLAARLVRHLEVLERLQGRLAVQATPAEGGEPARAAAVADPSPSGVVTVPTMPEASHPAVPAGLQAPAPAAPLAAPPWVEPDELTGLPGLGRFFSRAGQLLALEGRPERGRPASGTEGHALALVVVEVPDERTTPSAARALTGQLRWTDPVARVDRCLLAAALEVSGPRSADLVHARLVAAVRSCLGRSAEVRTSLAVAEAGGRRDVDELLAEALLRLRRLEAGGGGAPWRGAGGSAARLPIP